jgi:hypothetical protein
MTDVDNDDDIVTISHHEARHPVLARQLGHQVSAVALNRVGTLYCTTNPNSQWTEAVVALAGPAAEQRLRGYTFNQRNELWLTSWATDMANAERHLRQSDHAVSLRQAENVAVCLVEQHWATITRVADALAAAGQLSGTDLDRLRE